VPPTPANVGATATAEKREPASEMPWALCVQRAEDEAFHERFEREVANRRAAHGQVFAQYCVVGLLDHTSIESLELNRIFRALKKFNGNKERDVLLVLLTPGGSIEPAYQISKICKTYARSKFVVVVPRHAKSAGTLLALGADEIHMGALGQLGPIDPQLDGLPALGVSQALNSLAAVAGKHPGSAEMLSRYLKATLTVPQIGYCERIGESAVQYGERLLLNKKKLLPRSPAEIARELVHDYKDHSFVIDVEEAQNHLGAGWVKTDTPESELGEAVFDLYEEGNLLLGRKLLISGALDRDGVMRLEERTRAGRS
jgi:hypothetical protein